MGLTQVGDDLELSPLARGWLESLGDQPRRVAFADGDDDRVRTAATHLATLGLRPVLVCAETWEPPAGVEVRTIDELADGDVGGEVDALARAAGKNEEHALAIRHDPVYLAACLTRRGDTDATVAGAARPTSDVLRAGLQVIGLDPGVQSLTSSFLLHMPDERVFCFADCGVIPEPTADQLADIARSSAGTFNALTGEQPVVALLSFSTKGSAEHSSLARLRRAHALVNEADPDLLIDGELQFDAALVSSVAARKAPDSAVAGHANVFVFPDLASANIGYKIAERLGGARCYGPLLQGLAGAINDLSRGCSVNDVVNVALISAMQSRSS
jgi:phosphotransacetylase